MSRCDAPSNMTGRRILFAFLIIVGSTLAPDAAVAQSTEENSNLRACDNYMSLYAQSASRKLARALSGQGYGLQTLDLPDEIAADNGGQNTSYTTYSEKKGRAAGLVDSSRRARRSFTVVGTEQGPVMTSHLWPSRAEIAGGARCRPVSSRIEFPDVAVRSVDVEPFKYWGLRVSWHLPEKFDASSSDPDESVVRRVIAQSQASGSTPKRAAEPSNSGSSSDESGPDAEATSSENMEKKDDESGNSAQVKDAADK